MARYIEFNVLLSEVDKLKGISFDSRTVSNGYLYAALKGVNVDGHDFISKAIENGATYILCESDYTTEKEITIIKTESCSKSLAELASKYYDYPSSKLKLIGITGTNGKTTTVSLLHKLFISLGFKVGLISTIVNKIHLNEIPSTHTTPDSLNLNKLLNEMVNYGCEYVFMEVSSHSIVQDRIWGLDFYGGIFSNITHDHLDYHKTFDQYIKAKKLFFDNLNKNSFALTNIDDKNGEIMVQNTKARIYKYGLKNYSDFHAKILENGFEGLLLEIDSIEVCTNLIGKFNAYNLLAIYSTALLCGIDKMEVLQEISKLESAEGRFDVVRLWNGVIAIIDYAHTPDALINVLNTINDIKLNGEKLISIIGCGGDRDKEKRPIMARIGAEKSDILIITSDNPRTENPEEIIKDMEKGLDIILSKKSYSITNRAQAIKMAFGLANKGDIILIAGKGHEKYQEINGVKHHFDDKEEILKY